MTTSTITVEAKLQPDGVTLQREKKLSLPPGRVTVTVQAARATSGPAMLEVLDRIHRDQQQRGQRPMIEEEMAAELRAEDDEYEERWRHIWSQTQSQDRGGILILVYLDTVICVYAVEGPPSFQARARTRLGAFHAAGDRPAVSDLTWLECWVKPIRLADAVAPADMAAFLTASDVVRIPMPNAVY